MDHRTLPRQIRPLNPMQNPWDLLETCERTTQPVTHALRERFLTLVAERARTPLEADALLGAGVCIFKYGLAEAASRVEIAWLDRLAGA